MSVLIKGMEMPKSCGECIFEGFGGVENELSVCMLTGNNKPELSPERMSGCPLIELPPHGRLIDADKLHWIEGRDEQDNPVYLIIKNSVDVLPTIIPAEEGE